MADAKNHHVVIVGGGFGGLSAARSLKRAPVNVTLIDARNFHLFQPLSYQVATGALSSTEIAMPLRRIFRAQQNVRVLLGEVTAIDPERQSVSIAPGVAGPERLEIAYDTLILAGGSTYSYFGNDQWREHALEVKSLESAVAVRRRVLSAFEAAELEQDHERRAAWLRFVIVGGGPTGVEMAGQIAELARDALPREFRSVDTRDGEILLLEMGDAILSSFDPRLSARAERSLRSLGVTPMLGRRVVDIDADSVTIEDGGGERSRIAAHTIIWAAGVQAAELAGVLARATGAEADRLGRIAVEPDLTVADRPEILALGDMVRVRAPDGELLDLPGVAPVAMQQGRYAARLIADRLKGRVSRPFAYRDKGNLATIGRAKAVAELPGGIRLSGPIAWITWLLVHIVYLLDFQNRAIVLLRWSISFMTRGRGARLISQAPPQVAGENPDVASLGLPPATTALLFDLDGVLTRTAATHARAWKASFDQFLERWGADRDDPQEPFDLDEDYARHVDGKPRQDGIRAFLAARSITLPEGLPGDPPDAFTVAAIAADKDSRVHALIESEGVQTFDDSIAYVRRAHESGLRCAVVSSSANTQLVLRRVGIEDLFDARIDGVVAAERGLPGKPAPDTFLAGAAALHARPDQAVVFEDAIAGVQAGAAGGFALVVGVDRVGNGHGAALAEQGADIVVTDLGELIG